MNANSVVAAARIRYTLQCAAHRCGQCLPDSAPHQQPPQHPTAPPAAQHPPTSASCARLMSTRVLAAGCTMSRVFMMVAPSLLTVTARSVCMSLSMPRGPSVVRTTSATA